MADIDTTYLDAGTDSPRLARAALLTAVQRINMAILGDGRLSVGTNSTTTPRDAVLIRRAITGLTDCHAFRDESTISSVSDYGGYGVFDAKTSGSGTHNQNHLFSFQDRVAYTTSGAGVLQNQVGIYSEPEFYGGAGSVLSREGVRIMEYIGGAGIVAAQAGLVVRSLTKAAKNYGVVVQGAPMNVFGGRTVFGLVADPAINEGVSHYGAVLAGGAVASFQASGVGLGVAGTWSWAGYKSTPVLDGAASAGGTLVGFWAQDVIPGVGAPSVAASVGVSVDNLSGLSVFGLISQITAGATRWGLYLIGGAKNFIGGKSYFGGTTAADPTATLHIAAGSTAATSAPIKLTSGALMTTPENGAIEYDGAHLYITIGGVRKQLD